jgi:hypothetical protein
MVIAGLAIAGCGRAATSVSTTATNGFTTRSYDGSTSQGLPISFAATSTSVESVEFEWRATCADGQTHTNKIGLGGGSIQAGGFSLGGTLDTGAFAQVEGTVRGDRASGQLSRSGPSAFGTDCLATGVTWQAHAASG